MAAGIASLGDDDIGAGRRGFLGLRQRLHLADDLAAGVPDPAGERRGIAERQHHRRRLGIERHVQRRWVLLQRPKDETDADARIAGLSQFLADRVGVGIARADQTEPTGIGDGSGKPAAGGRTHRRQQDRMLDAEQTGQCGFDDGHARSFRDRLLYPGRALRPRAYRADQPLGENRPTR